MDTLLLVVLGGISILRTGLTLNPTDHCKNAKKVLEILPGRGWDSLQNQDMAQVVRLTYDNCKAINNGEFLIPDHMSSLAVKETNLELSTELFEHYASYVSATAKSFQVGLAFPFLSDAVSIAGSFSPEYSNVKTRQITDKAMTTRAYIRSTAFSILVEPAFELEPDLKHRLEKAANDLEMGNKTNDVQQAVELIVRDYGTHYQKRVDTGAMLLKEDFVRSSFVLKHLSERNQIVAAAGASFLDRISFGLTYRQTVGGDDEKAEGYNQSVIFTMLRTIGGPAMQPNMTESDWLSQIPQNMAVVDRSGDPLYFVINNRTLPNIAEETLTKLSAIMKNVIATYYYYNTHIGCMSMDSPNFNPQANVDDHSCHTPTVNSTFGGVFLNCTSEEKEAGDLCAELQQVNTLTGGLSCPLGFYVVPLNSGTMIVNTVKETTTQVCSGWWIFSKCHTETNNVHLRSKSTYDTFWCAASSTVAYSSGLLFGGLFTSRIPNPLTKSANCPPLFKALSAGTDLKVCVSEDFELAYKNSLDFGGFFSCGHGNPLSEISDIVANQTGKQADSYPRRCPDGFSQHTAAVDSGCSINYCLRNGALSSHGVKFSLIKPPFNEWFLDTTPSRNIEIKASTSAAIGVDGIYAIIAASMLIVLIIVLVVVIKLKSGCRKSKTDTELQPFIHQTD